MSEPSYVEEYQLAELAARVDLLEELHSGGLERITALHGENEALRSLLRDVFRIYKYGTKKITKGMAKQLASVLDERLKKYT